VNVPGQHNAENALLAVMMCERLGFPLDRVAVALRSFRGIERRLQTVGSSGGVTVIDDYAHNPAKIRAAWQTVQPYYRRTHCVWRPHGYGPLSAMMSELADVFTEIGGGQGTLCLLPVYDAGGTANRRVTSDMLVDQLKGRGVDATLVDEDAVVEALSTTARRRDAILVMGARDPGLPMLARRILQGLSQGS
jgi:UDP-N-acetylmuramate--alanine ligase